MDVRGYDLQTLAARTKLSLPTLRRIAGGKGGDRSSIEEIARKLDVTYRQLAGEEPGESEARAKQLISDNIKHYLKYHFLETQKTRAEKAHMNLRQMNLIINQHMEAVPLKPTLENLAKAIYGDDATIDDMLKPPTPGLLIRAFGRRSACRVVRHPISDEIDRGFADQERRRSRSRAWAEARGGTSAAPTLREPFRCSVSPRYPLGA